MGKNYSLPHDKRIDGSVLLDFALEAISEMKYSIGGVMEFLECEDNKFLMDFMGSEDIIYRLISGDALAETKLVYDKEADAVALLDYRGEEIPLGRISEDAVFINVNAE